MRAFGIIAALSAITSVFAAPMPTPVVGAEIPNEVSTLQGQDLTIVRAVVQLDINLAPILKTVHHVLDTVDVVVDTVEGTVGGVVEEVLELVADLTPAVTDLVHDVKGCALAIVGNVVSEVTPVLAPVTSLVGKTVEEVKCTLDTVQKDVAVVAAVVMTRVGDKSPDTFTAFQGSFDAFKTINAAFAKVAPGQEAPSIKSAIGDAQYTALKQAGFNLD
ncbi:hypothetical protein CPB86DRAFT_793248 [Serendipita vermifera]|nr:hypothetical protein CPB86DRAFT_793248 [Serendipita vermifera]